VLEETGIGSEASLNAKIGGKADEFIDLKNEVISSPEHYASLYLEGFKSALSKGKYKNSYDEMHSLFEKSEAAQEYLMLFLQRSYLTHYDELSKKRPTIADAEVWIGQNSADYGLLVTPRFAEGDWENDKSEIRHFKPKYWTIGHVMKNGLVIPGKNKRIKFNNVEDYLVFFEETLVRSTKSAHQIKIAELYCDYVRNSADPLSVPLLIPELRYEGRLAKHKYRLDFCVIDPITLQKTGFELSPWSTHGQLTGTSKKSQKQINAEAQGNFEKEIKKQRLYYKSKGIFVLIYTDTDLDQIDNIFSDIEECLNPKPVNTQLNFHLLSGLFKRKKKKKA
jgi:hypothetical protein